MLPILVPAFASLAGAFLTWGLSRQRNVEARLWDLFAERAKAVQELERAGVQEEELAALRADLARRIRDRAQVQEDGVQVRLFWLVLSWLLATYVGLGVAAVVGYAVIFDFPPLPAAAGFLVVGLSVMLIGGVVGWQAERASHCAHRLRQIAGWPAMGSGGVVLSLMLPIIASMVLTPFARDVVGLRSGIEGLSALPLLLSGLTPFLVLVWRRRRRGQGRSGAVANPRGQVEKG